VAASLHQHTTYTKVLPGRLYIVATPIGNLGDITLRALDTLRQVDHVAAEDTRHSRRLLQHFNITTPLIAYHDHSDDKREQKLLAHLQDDQSVALVSDAGTPLICDPGYTLVKQAIQRGIEVQSVPGPCALIATLSIAGLPTERFVFEGFLPAKTTARSNYLLTLQNEPRTLVFYESSHRILDSLRSMVQVFGHQREAVVCRELTKIYEICLRGPLGDLLERVSEDANQQRGEFVLVVDGYHAPKSESLTVEQQRIMKVLAEELSHKQAASIGAQLTGVKKRTLYQWLLSANSADR
jgi:16S rRNA (cytidine1402-2'-O)-methyltransferase